MHCTSRPTPARRFASRNRTSLAPWLPSLLPYAAAVVSGVLVAWCFPPAQVPGLPFVAWVPLFLALHPRATRPRVRTLAQAALPSPRLSHAFRLGLTSGVVTSLLEFSWITQLPAAQTTVPYLLVPAYLLVALYLGTFLGLAAMATVWLLRWLDWPLFTVAPVVWTLTDYVRGTGTMGFPWGTLGYALAPHAVWMQGAAVGGLWGLTLWVAVVNGLVVSVLLCPAWPGRMLRSSAVLWALVLPWWWGHARLTHTQIEPVGRVALVQGNIQASDKWNPALKDATIALYDSLTQVAAQGHPDLIIWPETAVPSYLNMQPADRRRVELVADRAQVPLLVGYPEAEYRPNGDLAFYNTLGLIEPGHGIVARYAKRHLVPFGEAIPGSTTWPVLRRINFGQGNFWPGREVTVFHPSTNPWLVASGLVCFESIFPSLGRDGARAGATILVNATNDEWFGTTAAPEQHAWMAVMRAVETGCGVARCANTGLTWIIDPLGRVSARYPAHQTGVLTGAVTRIGRTFYDRWGDWPVTLCAVLGAWFLALAVRHRAHARRVGLV